MTLDQFYTQVYTDMASLKDLNSANQHLTEQISTLQKELTDLKAAHYEEKMQTPVKMGLDTKEYIIQQKNSEVEALHIELATAKEEREAQNAYIDSLQKMLADLTDSQESAFDVNREIPSDTPVVVATARMNHALMYKIASCTDKKNIHYYNGTSMQNLYKVLLKEA